MAARTWREFFAQGQRRLPRGASFEERGKLTRELAREWRAMHGGEEPRQNPDGVSWGKVLLIGGGALAAYWLIKQQQGVTRTISGPDIPVVRLG